MTSGQINQYQLRGLLPAQLANEKKVRSEHNISANVYNNVLDQFKAFVKEMKPLSDKKEMVGMFNVAVRANQYVVSIHNNKSIIGTEGVRDIVDDIRTDIIDTAAGNYYNQYAKVFNAKGINAKNKQTYINYIDQLTTRLPMMSDYMKSKLVELRKAIGGVKDKAMQSELGGIDLNAALMDMVVDGGGDISLNNTELLDLSSIEGFLPKIISVQPFRNLLTTAN